MLKIQDFNKLIVANWKLNGSFSFTKEYMDQIRFKTIKNQKNCLIICPPVPYISEFKSSNLLTGGQDCSRYINGAYTGEISTKMLKDMGCQICIVGHSERREFFNDSNEIIHEKLNNCIENKIIPVFCIGENLNQRKEGRAKQAIKDQLMASLPKDYSDENIILAYEPLWAIGSGLVPKIDEICEIHSYIKEEVLNNQNIKILYGGSVKAENYKKIIDLREVDGLLIGGASIQITEFNKILEF